MQVLRQGTEGLYGSYHGGAWGSILHMGWQQGQVNRLCLGRNSRDTIVIGVPGYPVSAYLAFEWFAQPLICEYLQVPVPKREMITVRTLAKEVK